MGGIKIKIHPLTFLFALFLCASKKAGVFVVYTLTALIHEIGHGLVAEKLGYRLSVIKLMPFGATISSETQGFSALDEIKVAIAGPLINLSVGLFFVALWWIFPETYTYTDICAEANFVMALVNFIPAYPLDGGRVLVSALSLSLKRKTAIKICKISGIILSAALFCFFIISCFHAVNISLLFFSLFVLIGGMDKKKEAIYIRINSFPSERKMKKGVNVKRQAIDKSAKVKDLLVILDKNAVNEILVFDEDNFIGILSQKKLKEITETGGLYSEVSDFL